MAVVSVTEVKKYLRIPDEFVEDDDLLGDLAEVSQEELEDYLNLPLTQRSLIQKFFGLQAAWFLDARPVSSITSILDGEGNSIDAEDYVLIEERGQILFRRFPRIARNAQGLQDRWTVTYVAGLYPDEASAPARVKQAIKMLVARRYQRPEPDIQGIRTLNQSVSYIPNPNNRKPLPPEVVELVGSIGRILA